MKSNFQRSLELVLQHEGGFVNHPQDPGGATNKGVTQVVYDDFRMGRKLPKRSVREITSEEVQEIYRLRYWNLIKGDDLPKGLDYCIFDFAVNSGTGRAAQFLQRAVDATPDGKIGPMTLAALEKHCVEYIIERVCNDRLAFLKGLRIFSTFGRGWTRRVEDVRRIAKEMDKN